MSIGKWILALVATSALALAVVGVGVASHEYTGWPRPTDSDRDHLITVNYKFDNVSSSCETKFANALSAAVWYWNQVAGESDPVHAVTHGSK